jgi:hypothetical protein
MTRNTVKVSTLGLTRECIQEDFIMESNMARALTAKLVAKKFMVFGRRVKRPRYAKLTKSSKSLKITFET